VYTPQLYYWLLRRAPWQRAGGKEQVDVIREIEVGQAREQEAARWRHELSRQREELEKLYSQRLKHLHAIEEATAARAQDLQRAAERRSSDMEQRMVAEEDRMRAALQVRLDRPSPHQPPGAPFNSALSPISV
jgi:hypothetical protein